MLDRRLHLDGNAWLVRVNPDPHIDKHTHADTIIDRHDDANADTNRDTDPTAAGLLFSAPAGHGERHTAWREPPPGDDHGDRHQ